MARRSSSRIYQQHVADVQSNVNGALYVPVRRILAQRIEGRIFALVDERIRKTERLIHELKAIDSSINVGPEYAETRIEVIFDKPDDIDTNTSWLEGWPVFRTVVGVKHSPFVGKETLRKFIVERNKYSDMFSMRMPWTGPYVMVDEVLDAHDTEAVSNMLAMLKTVHCQLGKWTQQFRLTPEHDVNKDAIHHACHFSSTFRMWAKKVKPDFVPKLYMRRPNVQLQTPMSPELNAALSLAYALSEANTEEVS